MSTIVQSIHYTCFNDCVVSGCPGHKGTLEYQSCSDTYIFTLNGRVLPFNRTELHAMIALLKSLGRVDSVRINELLKDNKE